MSALLDHNKGAIKMSRQKKDRNFPSSIENVSSLKLAKIISVLLHRDFGQSPSPIKRIGQATNINLRLIKNWYQAKNAPSSNHLITLARSSPSVLKYILIQIGGNNLWEVFKFFSIYKSADSDARLHSSLSAKNSTQNVPINVPINNLNPRQKWFLGVLQVHDQAYTKDIMLHFNVTLKTAKRDIKKLAGAGIIKFVGSKKSGHYYLNI